MPLLKMTASGRGAFYSRKRGVLESVARVVYRGAWPARLLGRVPGYARVDLVHHTLPLLPRRTPSDPGGGGRRPLRVAFASDLHIGPLTPPAVLDNAFALLAQARPDVLVLGGDYVFLEATPEMAQELEERVAAVPAAVKVAVLGNHDLWTRHELIEAALARAGVQILINDGVRLPAPFDDVAVLGLDEPWTGQPDPERALGAGAVSGAALRLGVAHSPEAVPMLAGRGLALLLCGHTHGGQIALPGGPVVVHGKHGRIWPAGLYELGDMRLFVSRGLGAVELPLRLYARPDVALFELTT